MNRARRSATFGAGLAAATAWLVVAAPPAAAHGVGGRQDLPLETWQVAWGAASAVVISFAALGLLWSRPHLDAAAGGRRLPGWLQLVATVAVWTGRLVVAGLWLLIVVAGFAGSDSPAENIAPVTFYVVFWVGAPLLCAFLGDIWADIGPASWLTLSRPATPAKRAGRWADNDWPAVVGVGGFAWLELAYHSSSSPRAIGVFVVAYTVFVGAGVARFGPGWARHGDGFAVLFRLIGGLAPLGRDPSGPPAARRAVTLRPPIAGLAKTTIYPGTLAVILVALGSTTFDGFTRTRLWGDIVDNRVGWSRTGVATIGLVWTIAVVTALYLAAIKVTARMTRTEERVVADQYAPALVPIMLAYAIAHYFSLLVFESQNFRIQLSDPLGRGWDLLGTATDRVDYLVIGTTTIAWAQVGAIVAGHIAGVVVSHDRAVSLQRGPGALRSQYPLLVAMVVLTVGGLLLLLSG